jgi:hypothetical protein
MPPQQDHALLDLIGEMADLGAHDRSPLCSGNPFSGGRG